MTTRSVVFVRSRPLLGAALLGLLLTCCSDSKPSSPGNTSPGGSAGAGAGASGNGPGSATAGTESGGVSSGAGGGLGGTTGASGATGGGGSAAGGVGGSGAGAGAGGMDMAGSAGAATGSACAGKHFALCEDFETGVVDGVPDGWTALKGFGSADGVGLATDQKHGGSMSLKSNSGNTGQGRVQKSLSALGATASVHFGRIFYKVQSPAQKPNGGVIHLTLTALEGTTEDRVVDTVENSSGAYQFLFNIPDDSCCVATSYDYHFDDGWHCAEWHVSVPDQSYQFWIDGTEVRSLAFTGRAGAKMSNFKSVAVGAIFYQKPPSPIVVWFDDLAIDDARVGCN